MNTISITTMSAGTATVPGLRLPDTRVARFRAPAEWLPVPVAPRPATSNRRTASTPAQLWLHAAPQPRSERILFALLTVAAVVAIGYGFSCLIDLVQQWALFQGGIANLVQ